MKSIESHSSAQSRLPSGNLILVLLGILLATVIRFPFQPTIHNASPFLFYFPVVIMVAAICGHRYGLIATALSVVPANYFWMAPEHAFAIDLDEFCQIIGFSFAGLSISWLSQKARKRKELDEHLRATLASMADAVVTTDPEGKIVYLNAAAQVLTQLQNQHVAGSVASSALNLLTETGRDSLNAAFQAAVNHDALERLPKRLILMSETGQCHRVVLKASRILDARGNCLGLAMQFSQIE